MSSKIESKYNVPGLDRALSIIELLNKNPAGLSVNEIAHSLKYPLNSIYRIMMTLERRKYVRKQSGESVFVLSDKFLTLATPVAGEPAFIETAMPFMRDLRDELWSLFLPGYWLEMKEWYSSNVKASTHSVSESPLVFVFPYTQQHRENFFWHTSRLKRESRLWTD